MARQVRSLMMIALGVPALCAITSALPVRAQNPRNDASGNDSFFLPAAHDPIWTGRVRGDDKQFHDAPLSPTYGADLHRELAQIQLSIDVDRKLDEARAKLDDLAIRATRRGYEGRKDVLVEVALARSKLLETLGKIDEARQAVTSVLVNQSIAAGQSKYELVAPTAADNAEAGQIKGDARLVAARAQLAAARPEAQANDTSDAIEQVVMEFLNRSDAGLSTELGLPAVPTLRKLLSSNLEELPPLQADALWHFIKISPSRAADFILANFDHGGPIWKARIVRAMNMTGALSNGGAMAEQPWGDGQQGEPPRLAIPQWKAVIEQLILDPATTREALPFVRQLAYYDALDAGLRTDLARILDSSNASLVQGTLTALQDSDHRLTVKPLLESVLSSPNADVRRFATDRLLQYQQSDGLLAAGDSQDSKVREAVARALRGRTIQVLSFQGMSAVLKNEWASPTLDGPQRETMVRLVSDPDPAVRNEAAISVSQLETPLGWSVYESMAKDPDSRVRLALLLAKNVSTEDRAHIALTLATDKDPKVLQGFDTYLFAELAPSSPSSEYTGIDPAFYPVIEARRLNAVRHFEEANSQNQKMRLYEVLGQRTEGLQALVRWASHEDDSYLLEWIVWRLFHWMNDNEDRWARRVASPIDLAGVTPETWAALFDAAHRSSKKGLGDKVTRVLVLLDLDLSQQILPIAKDPSRPLKTRLDACDVAANGRDPQLGNVLISVLDDTRRNTKTNSADDAFTVMTIAAVLGQQSTSRDLDAALADTALPDLFGMAIVAGWAKSHELDARQSGMVLERWLGNRMGQEAGVVAALQTIAKLPREQQRDWIVRAAHDSRYASTALTLIGDMRDPSYLGLLEEFLAPGFKLEGAGEVQLEALNALTRYFDDAAADLILKVAGSTASSKLRDACFKALETIRKYQEEKGRWKSERSSIEAWTKSVNDLVALLDDPEATVRVQAVRALGTLGARQEMPHVVRMLKDKDESVRKAAEEALGTLNTLPK